MARPGTIDGSSNADETLTGKNGANTFHFEAGTSGDDRITKSEATDVLALDRALYDRNKDRVIALGGHSVSLDGQGTGDKLAIDGVDALRFLGLDDAGHYIYADAGVRPRGAQESTLADDVFSGGSVGKKDVFFFDTTLGLSLGKDTIIKFDDRDSIVTTSKIMDGNQDGIITGTSGTFKLDDSNGSLTLWNVDDSVVTALKYDATFTHDDVSYYVYSTIASASLDTNDLIF